MVMNSDEDAQDFVLLNQSSSAFPLADYPDYAPDVIYSEDVVSFLVAVGNVVVYGSTSEQLVISTGNRRPGVNYIEPYAAALANYGVDRLLRVGGQPDDAGAAGNTL